MNILFPTPRERETELLRGTYFEPFPETFYRIFTTKIPGFSQYLIYSISWSIQFPTLFVRRVCFCISYSITYYWKTIFFLHEISRNLRKKLSNEKENVVWIFLLKKLSRRPGLIINVIPVLPVYNGITVYVLLHTLTVLKNRCNEAINRTLTMI